MKENQIQVFQYNGSPVTFNTGDSVMVNATEMAKPFGKSATHWLRNQSTKDFIDEYAALRNRNPLDLVQTINGDNGGTWMHEDVAMEFARWLSPKFAIWCNDRIKELLTKGSTSIAQLSRKELALMVVQAEEERERLALENERQKTRIAADKPKVDYYDEVLTSTDTMTVTQIAKCLGRSGRWLNSKLRDCGLIYFQSGQWLLKSPYDRWRLHDVRPHKITHADGTVGMRQATVWTERGKRMIMALSRCGWKIATAIRIIRGEEEQQGKEVAL